MLKFEGFTKGQKIKAFDHEPMPEALKAEYPDRFVVGEILEVIDSYEHPRFRVMGCFCYKIAVTEDTTWTNRPRTEVFVPFQTSMDYDERVQLIG